MPDSWHDLLRTLDSAFSPDDVTVRRRAKPVPPDLDNDNGRYTSTLLDASIDLLAVLCVSLADVPHACVLLDDRGFVVHVVEVPVGAAADRGWVRGAHLFQGGALPDELLAGRPVVTTGDGGDELLMPVCARGTPVVGVLVLACNPAHLPSTAAATILATTQAIALAMQVADLQRHNERVLGTIGHELRQPLSALVTALDLVARTSRDVSANPLRIAQRQTHQILRLVEALLDTSRLARGKLRVARRLLDLRDLVRDGVDAVRPDVDAKQQILHVVVPDRPVWSSGDPARLQQVVVNLVSNASRYTPAGGTIDVSVSSDDSRVKLTVSDTGEGIDPDVRERIFQPFTHARSSQGLGLGLTISRAIAELHGGTLVAESGGRGHGSRFVLDLPGVLERTREVREAVTRTREETRELVERARMLRASLVSQPKYRSR